MHHTVPFRIRNNVDRHPENIVRPILAGLVTALVGFTSSFAVVLTGLRALGASDAEAASGLLALCVTQGLGTVILTLRHRIPVVLAWSTPGAALLAGTGLVTGGWPAAVGAFVVTGLLILLTAAWPRLGDLITAIPVPLAQAMLAGILLPLCLAPVLALVDVPGYVAPVVLTWIVLLRLAPRWAVPAALLVALVAIMVGLHGHGQYDALLQPPVLVWTAPQLTWQAVVGIAVPLYIVTMASQNVPGVAVMSSFGYTVPWRAAMGVTGLGTVAGAFAGGHAINLAAITAALSASPDADPDPRRRWLAAHTAGWTYLFLALGSAALAAACAAAPDGVVEAAAGLALLGTMGGALSGAFGSTESREAPAVTFVVAASGVSVLGVGSAFWALVSGLVVWHLLRRVPRAAERGSLVGR
jgi:benzoate membrane transport protein